MTDLFFYGTLCHAPLLAAVLGRAVVVEPAALPGYEVFWSADGPWPVIRASAEGNAGAMAPGALLRGATAEDLARLNYYAGGFGFAMQELPLAAGRAFVFLPPAGVAVAGPWLLQDWVGLWGAAAVATATDIMALRGQRSGAEVARRYGQMLVRGASRVRAHADAHPTTRRRSHVAGDVQIAAQRQPYAHYFAVEEYDLRFRRFDGTMSPEINRAVFVSGDAVTVLPYDPQRDRVLLVEQFRAGPLGRGDPQPWMLEAIAGRIDPEESPEQAARREAVEEAGLTLGAMEYVGGYYPSPGAKMEYLYSYVALCDLPDGSAGVFGVEGEAEDIRGHLLSFEALMALVESGEIDNGPLLLTVLWLQRERARLRA